MKRSTKISIIFTVLISILFSFTSCSNKIGYGVILWNLPEYGLMDGDVVPVYIKSNISHQYVIGIPETKEKIEIPLWQLSEPEKRGKAVKRSNRYKPYQNTYARCVLDGLPIRQDSINTSKQVYRLREGEVIRCIYESSGAIPTNGKTNLEGKWLKVLTSTGVSGWCFSYNLRLFKADADGTIGSGEVQETVTESNALLETVLTSKWYPDYYNMMISSGNIDSTSVNPSFGFDTGFNSGTVSVKLLNLNVSYPYAGVTKIDDDIFKFNNTPIQITIRNGASIVVQYTNEKGMPKSYGFITLDDEIDIEALVQNEINKREELYNSIRNLGPTFRSTNYGTLTFNEDNFVWNGFNRLIPTVIPSGTRNFGSASIKYSIPNNLKAEWNGVLTMNFEGYDKEINFLYKKESNGLRLCTAKVTPNYNETTGRTTYRIEESQNAVVMFFEK